jgi:hypothetical protein
VHAGNAPAIVAPCHGKRRKVPKKSVSIPSVPKAAKAEKVSETSHCEPAKAILYHALRSGRSLPIMLMYRKPFIG